jgi:membrane-bound metal-dependent hydrolase YbcI (DUF457 family)
MMTPTHLSIGYIIAYQAMRSGLFPHELQHSLITISMLSSVLPDIDSLAVWKAIRHRQNSPFHYPVFWAFIILGLAAFFAARDQRLYLTYTLLAGVNIAIHLFLDTFSLNEGIKWFYPFSKIEYNFIKVPKADSVIALAKRTLVHPMTKIEAAIWVIALIVRLKS